MVDTVTAVDSALAAMTEAGTPAFSPENVAPKPAVEKAENTPQNQTENDDDGEGDETPDPTQPFPKKAVNAINRRTKQIKRLAAENQTYAQNTRALELQLAELRGAQGAGKPPVQATTQAAAQAAPQAATNYTDPNDPAPQHGDVDANGKSKYDTFGDFVQAQARWAARQELYASKQAEAATNKTKEVETQKQQAVEKLTNEAKTFVESVPDAKAVLEANLATINQLGPHVENVLLQIENAPLALYNLAKEGKLAALNSLSPTQVAMEIGRALAAGIPAQDNANPNPPQQVSSAPPPPSKTASGAGANSTPSLDSLNPRDLMKRLAA